jgi:uncharacterized protein (TIGR02246 family)
MKIDENKSLEINSLKNRLQILEDKEAIRDLLARYAFNVDLSRFDAFFKLWTDDAVFITDGPGEAIQKRGKDEIREFLSGVLPKSNAGSQHLQLDYVIEISGNTAMATGYQLISIQQKDRVGIARCALRSFVFKREDGKWLIKEAISRSTANDAECQKLVPADW